MIIEERDIFEIARAVWANVLQMDPQGRPGGTIDGRVVTGCVQFSGEWEGAITLRCSMALARLAAGLMLDVAPERATDEDIRDALGELANMVGGNVKALLPGPTQLSLPLVVEGDNDALTICDSEAVHTVWMVWRGEPFVVSLHARVREGADARARLS
jgi:chemotaxis protein CheX